VVEDLDGNPEGEACHNLSLVATQAAQEDPPWMGPQHGQSCFLQSETGKE
jgi:hypothetical protein